MLVSVFTTVSEVVLGHIVDQHWILLILLSFLGWSFRFLKSERHLLFGRRFFNRKLVAISQQISNFSSLARISQRFSRSGLSLSRTSSRTGVTWRIHSFCYHRTSFVRLLAFKSYSHAESFLVRKLLSGDIWIFPWFYDRRRKLLKSIWTLYAWRIRPGCFVVSCNGILNGFSLRFNRFLLKS